MVAGACALVDQNISTWGSCLTNTIFLGDPTIATIGILGIMIFIAYKLNIPHETSLMLGIGTIFMMAIIYGSSMNSLVALTVLVVSIILLRAVMKPAKN